MSRRSAPTVASWNVWMGNTPANIRRGLRALIDAGADVIGCQELSVDASYLDARSFMATLGWGSTAKNNAIPIFFDEAVYDLVDEDYQVVNLGGEPWEPGTGGDTVIRKALTWVRLKHRATGEETYVVNNHIVPGIEADGQIRKDVPKRLAVYVEQMDALAEICRAFSRTGAAVAATGDFNLAHNEPSGEDLRRRMGAVGFRSCWQALGDDQPTHGDRIIDYVWFDRCWAKSDRVLDKYGSDHSPVVCDLNPYLRTYVVDRSRFVDPDDGKNFLWGVNVATGEAELKRKPGFAITTGVAITTIKGRKWLVTEAGYRYALSFLRPA